MTRTFALFYKATYRYRERIFVVLVAAIVLAALAYAFLLQKAIINVVQREKISAEAKSIAAGMGELEVHYFTLKNKVTLDLAHSKGLKDATSISYISRKSLTAMASHNEL